MVNSSRKGRKNKFQNVHEFNDIYSEYISDKETGTLYYIDKPLFKKILSDYIEHIKDLILEGHVFYVPFGLGSMYIYKEKITPGKGMTIDWKLSNFVGKRVYHLNEHSNGYKYKFKWDKFPCRFRNHRMYRLSMVRNMKRTLAKYIKQLGYDYIEE